ncbi:DUF3021 domain-containing protein [Diplocloster hominis]|uniref:DUF3021 domain-containing protein n=1 Tax=Diplocloster hominis TaxID=3079010 RepID=UPI0031BB4FBB
MKKILKLFLMGIAWGCTMNVFIGMFGVATSGPEFLISNTSDYYANIIAGIIIGLGFTIPSVVYDKEEMARGIQVLIHLGIGLTIYFIAAFWRGWVPLQYGAGMVIGMIAGILAVTGVIWFCFYLYYRNEAMKINKKLKEK